MGGIWNRFGVLGTRSPSPTHAPPHHTLTLHYTLPKLHTTHTLGSTPHPSQHRTHKYIHTHTQLGTFPTLLVCGTWAQKQTVCGTPTHMHLEAEAAPALPESDGRQLVEVPAQHHLLPHITHIRSVKDNIPNIYDIFLAKNTPAWEVKLPHKTGMWCIKPGVVVPGCRRRDWDWCGWYGQCSPACQAAALKPQS